MIDIPEAVLFYLRHQAQIDEWATLADKVPAVAHEFYLGLGPKLEAAAMGERGRRDWQSSYQWSHVADRFEGALEDAPVGTVS